MTVLRNGNYEYWPFLVRDLYNKHFSQAKSKKKQNELPPVSSMPEVEEKSDKAGADDGTKSGGTGMMDETAVFRMRNELVRQRDWMNKKLNKVIDANHKLEKDKKDLLLKIQKENTELINDCNTLRSENHVTSRRVLQLEKKFKEITGISLTNVKSIERDLEKFLKTSSVKHTPTNKATPFQQRKNAPLSTRNQTILEYYHKFAFPPNVNTANANLDNLTSILGDLDKNKEALASQNQEMQKLHVCPLFLKLVFYYC